PALVEDIRVGSATAQAVARRVAGALERHVRDLDDGVVALEPVAAVALRDLRLHLAILEAGRERKRVDHLLDEIAELALVVRARFGTQRAPLGDDVPGASALDQPDVRGRLVVDTAEPEVGDRTRGRRNR